MTSQIIPFQFGTHDVRTLLVGDQPWFVASDVSAALHYSAPSAMTRHLDEDEKGVSTVHTPGGDQELLTINESGLYSAILRSRKAEAKRFKKWVTSEVLPSIRRSGAYCGDIKDHLPRRILIGGIIHGERSIQEVPEDAFVSNYAQLPGRIGNAFGATDQELIDIAQACLLMLSKRQQYKDRTQ